MSTVHFPRKIICAIEMHNRIPFPPLLYSLQENAQLKTKKIQFWVPRYVSMYSQSFFFFMTAASIVRWIKLYFAYSNSVDGDGFS